MLYDVVLAQVLALLGFLAQTIAACLLHLPVAVLRCFFTSLRKQNPEEGRQGCTFYEGVVFHERHKPVHNAFRYNVRMAVVDLDRPPAWWRKQAKDHMTAPEARALAGTDGGVLLLTTPISAGYTQNPISVYYCLEAAGGHSVCIAEVTNTPWGARVTFLFRPDGQRVPKAMHVSPFMDMDSTWTIKAPLPDNSCYLSVSAMHPELGPFFTASFRGQRSRSALHSDEAGLKYLIRYGFMPHRVAFWIYWQAVRLVMMGVPFYSYPALDFQRRVEQDSSTSENSHGQRFHWQEPKQYPWNAC